MMHTGTNLNMRIAIHHSLVATAINIIDGADTENGFTIRRTLFRFKTSYDKRIITMAIGYSMLTKRKLGRILIDILGSNMAFLHVHIDVRSTDKHSLLTTAIDCANLRSRNNVYLRMCLGEAIQTGFRHCRIHIILVIWIYTYHCRDAVGTELLVSSWLNLIAV